MVPLQAFGDFLQLVGRNSLAAAHALPDSFELDERIAEALTLRACDQPGIVELHSSEQCDTLLDYLGVATGNELVQPIDDDVFDAEDRNEVAASKFYLDDFFLYRREARWGLDKDLRVGQHPVAAFK